MPKELTWSGSPGSKQWIAKAGWRVEVAPIKNSSDWTWNLIDEGDDCSEEDGGVAGSEDEAKQAALDRLTRLLKSGQPSTAKQ